jgi:hypothetical protein
MLHRKSTDHPFGMNRSRHLLCNGDPPQSAKPRVGKSFRRTGLSGHDFRNATVVDLHLFLTGVELVFEAPSICRDSPCKKGKGPCESPSVWMDMQVSSPQLDRNSTAACFSASCHVSLIFRFDLGSGIVSRSLKLDLTAWLLRDQCTYHYIQTGDHGGRIVRSLG